MACIGSDRTDTCTPGSCRHDVPEQFPLNRARTVVGGLFRRIEKNIFQRTENPGGRQRFPMESGVVHLDGGY